MSHPVKLTILSCIKRVYLCVWAVMTANSESEMENVEDYFSDVDMLNVSFSELEIGVYFTLLYYIHDL